MREKGDMVGMGKERREVRGRDKSRTSCTKTILGSEAPN